jgi:hypothetical protein
VRRGADCRRPNQLLDCGATDCAASCGPAAEDLLLSKKQAVAWRPADVGPLQLLQPRPLSPHQLPARAEQDTVGLLLWRPPARRPAALDFPIASAILKSGCCAGWWGNG